MKRNGAGASRDAGHGMSRRGLLRRSVAGGVGMGLLGGPLSAAAASGDGYGPLLPADGNNLRLPRGFTSRVVAVSNLFVGTTGHRWHLDPDGGATFTTGDGGWVYVSNSEENNGDGGVGVLRFNGSGTVIDAYSILTGTSRNCAGGPTPWGTWLSCEETSTGEVWECDPLAPGSNGTVRPMMGKFHHEAAAVDPVRQMVFLTEDRSDGLLYRFRPSAYPNLASGTLEAAEVLDPMGQGPIAPGQVRPLAWHMVPDPTFSGGTPTRYQVAAATSFDGGEGCWFGAGAVYFTTKGDNRVWRFDPGANQLSIVYDFATSPTPELSGVDNVYVSPRGDVIVAEDQGDYQIVALTQSGGVVPIVQLVGVTGSEITGPALSPDGTRLYFSSQRNPGITFEVTGPFLGGITLPLFGAVQTSLVAAALAALGAAALRDRGDEATA